MSEHDITCIGAVHWDMIARAAGRLGQGADEPGRIIRRPGGVAFNIARGLARQGLRPRLVSALGVGEDSSVLVELAAESGIAPSFLHLPMQADLYIAIEDQAGLVAAVADSRVLEAAGLSLLDLLGDGVGPVVADTNMPEPVLSALSLRPGIADLRLVSAGPGKARRLRPFLGRPHARLYLNRTEAGLLLGADVPDAAAAARALSAAGVARAIVTDGAAAAAELVSGTIRTALPPPVSVRRVTGAGDAFTSAHIAADLRGAGPGEALAAALAAAARHIEEPIP